ncbi:MAG: hypothetical protein JO001_12135 [Alphaproteobacteria bacterium]|nr:hypothetical protein [Alphaproteobacteria bacterium]
MRGIVSRLLGLTIIVLAAFALVGAALAQPRGAVAPVAGQQAPMSPGTAGSASGLATAPRGNNVVPPGSLPTAVAPDANGGNAMPATGDLGICQCIADRTTRTLSCLGSAAECQSTCASTHFAYTPHAIYSCAAPGTVPAGRSPPAAPQSASAATSSGR